MMNNRADEQYLRIMRDLLDRGVYREGRNGGTYGLFGEQMRFDLSEGFPLLTTKKVHFKSIVVELLWMLRGDTNTKFLHDHGVTIWDEWQDENGNLGPVYGEQWRRWPRYKHYGGGEAWRIGDVDQIANVVAAIKADPYSRRHIVIAWNPATVDEAALPACHMAFQFHVANGKLSCRLDQRSADWLLGVPFNIASYALLTHLVAREVGLQVGDLVHQFGDLHLYANHVEQAEEQLRRAPRHLPELAINRHAGIFEYEPADISIVGYDPHPSIKAEVSA